MKNETRPISDAAGEAAVWAFSGERLTADRSISPDNPAYAFARTDRVIDPAVLADVRLVDLALRSLADADAPHVADVARARQRALETTRLFAADRLRRPNQVRARAPLAPRWAIASAVAAAVAVGLVAWLSNDVPTIESRVAGVPAAPGVEGSEESDPYLSLMTAFNSIGSRDALGGGSLDEIQNEVDALSGLTSVDN